jgi:hypothetical protein
MIQKKLLFFVRRFNNANDYEIALLLCLRAERGIKQKPD